MFLRNEQYNILNTKPYCVVRMYLKAHDEVLKFSWVNYNAISRTSMLKNKIIPTRVTR
jgi:hypothetical protein